VALTGINRIWGYGDMGMRGYGDMGIRGNGDVGNSGVDLHIAITVPSVMYIHITYI
jgi:hypothetical protein